MAFALGQRLIVLILDDFDADPAEVSKLVPAQHIVQIRKGDALRGGAGLSLVNRLIVSEAFELDLHWPEALEKLFAAMGGEAHLRSLLERFAPKNRIIEYWVPVNGSPHQENNSLDASTLRRIVALGLDLGFAFPAFDESSETAAR